MNGRALNDSKEHVMGYRQEIREVAVKKNVMVFECDNCGMQTQGEDEHSARPDGWFGLNATAESTLFCSYACLRSWVNGDKEYTEIARKAFSKTTGAA